MEMIRIRIRNGITTDKNIPFVLRSNQKQWVIDRLHKCSVL